jgi:hypothetical protein
MNGSCCFLERNSFLREQVSVTGFGKKVKNDFGLIVSLEKGEKPEERACLFRNWPKMVFIRLP